MNILFLHSSSDLYGASKILLTTVRLIKDKFSISVVLSEEGPLAVELRKEKVDVQVIRLGILRRKYLSVFGLINRARVMLQALKKLKELVNKKKIDVVYSNTSAVLIGAILSKKCNLKHVWHIHEIIPKPIWFSRFIGFMLNKYSDNVIVVSDAVKDHWIHFVNDKSKLQTIYNGIDYEPYLNSQSTLREELKISEDSLLIGMIGRVHFWKGQNYFIELASLIHKSIPTARFVMVGDAFPGYEHLHDELDKQKESLHLNEVIYDLGFRNDIPQILCGLDVFVSPSILPDPLPTVILEAMASSKPIIATNHGGAKEMVLNEITGVLIPWDNKELAFDLIKDLIQDKKSLSEMGLRGQERVLEFFSLNSYKANILKLFNSLK